MKAFIDTSTLIKKYIEEDGTEAFEKLLEQISEIIVSPVYLLEVHSVIERRLKERALTREQAAWLRSETKKDYEFFHKVAWSENLEMESLRLIEKYRLKTLDSIQLASGCISVADIFITSDKNLFRMVQKEIKNTRLI